MAWMRTRTAADGSYVRLSHSICFSWLAFCLACSSLISFSSSLVAAPLDGPPPRRYLLVVETSQAMQSRADVMLQAVHELLSTGMDNHARPSDTLGIWTFNRDLYAGFFPLETWSPGALNQITLRALTFLRTVKYANQPSFDPILPELARLVRDSEPLTVILISGGLVRVRGTPFDSQINDAYASWLPRLPKARRLFLTALHASHGRITGYSVTPASFPLDLAPPAADLLAPAPTKAVVPAQSLAPVPTPGRPVEKLQPQVPETSIPPAALSSSPLPGPPVPKTTLPLANPPQPAATSSPPAAGQTPAQPQPTLLSVPVNPTPIQVERSPQLTLSAPGPAITNGRPPPALPSGPILPKLIQGEQPLVSAVPSAAGPAPGSAPATNSSAPAIALAPAIPKPAQAELPLPPTVPAPSKPVPDSAVTNGPSPTPSPSGLAIPKPIRTEPPLMAATPPGSPVFANANPPSVLAPSPPSTQPVGSISAAASSAHPDPEPAIPSTWKRVSLWTGAVLGLTTLTLSLFFLRRVRAAPSTSLITRALEQERFLNSIEGKKETKGGEQKTQSGKRTQAGEGHTKR
jgi:hypothetical protein